MIALVWFIMLSWRAEMRKPGRLPTTYTTAAKS